MMRILELPFSTADRLTVPDPEPTFPKLDRMSRSSRPRKALRGHRVWRAHGLLSLPRACARWGAGRREIRNQAARLAGARAYKVTLPKEIPAEKSLVIHRPGKVSLPCLRLYGPLEPSFAKT